MSKTMTMSKIFNKSVLPEIIELTLSGDGYNDITLRVKRALTFEESMRFIASIYASCVDEENGEFRPEALDLSIRIFTLVFYAGISLPLEKVKSYYNALYCSDLYDRVFDVIDHNQFDVNICAVHDKINYWRQQAASVGGMKLMELMSKVDEMVNGSAEAIANIDMDGLSSAVESLKSMSVLPADTDSNIEERQTEDGGTDIISGIHRVK